MAKTRTYFCIDMKSFYASVECAERGYNPFETNLVVADLTRGKNALCLAITPAMKAQGIRNRCRLSEIPSNVKYEVAPPRMALYIEYAADIYSLYLDYFDPRDIHVYSIDESFLDVTDYLAPNHMDAVTFAKHLMNEIADRFHIPATAGIGTNLYLAKIALDITAKHAKDHVGVLDEEKYRQTLWDHRPITDFWMVAGGTARRLERYGVFDMRGVTQMDTGLMYKVFGKNAELLIDHAWGWEPVTMDLVRAYRPDTRSMSSGQVLQSAYTVEKARIVVLEMAHSVSLELVDKKLLTDQIVLTVGYDIESLSNGIYEGNTTTDHYGWKIPVHAHGTTNIEHPTSSGKILMEKIGELFDRIINPDLLVRRLTLSINHLVSEVEVKPVNNVVQLDLFPDYEKMEREKAEKERLAKERRRQEAVIQIKKKFGKNSILTGLNYSEGATQKERNQQIGGHHE